MRACVPSSSNWLPPLKKLKGLEAPLKRLERPLKNWAWQTPTKRTATAAESGASGLMTMVVVVVVEERVWIWCHFQND